MVGRERVGVRLVTIEPVALEVVTRPDLLTAAPTDDVVALQRAFLDLSAKLLDPSDFQRIGGKEYKTKSAWRKLAAAFNVSDAVLERNYTYGEDGRIMRAEYVAIATAPNGRSAVGVGIASVYERSFSNPEHDIPATAHTRAKNRAFSDLFGLGEVSADEIANADERPPRGAEPAVTWRSGASAQRAANDARHGRQPANVADVVARFNRLGVDGRRDFTAWRKSKAYPWPPTTKAEVMAMVAEMVRVESGAARDADTYGSSADLANDNRTPTAAEGFPTTTHGRRRRDTKDPDTGATKGTERTQAAPVPGPTTPDEETPNETPSGANQVTPVEPDQSDADDADDDGPTSAA